MPRKFVSALVPSARAPAISAGIGAVVLAAWLIWFFAARLSVYEVSHSARVEVDLAPHPLDAPLSGRVIKSALVLGAEVKAGDVLVELEADELALDLQKERVRLAGLAPQIAAVEKELSADARAVRGEGLVASAAHDEATARQRAFETLAALKSTERRQIEALLDRRAVAELESTRITSEAAQRLAEAQAAQGNVRRVGGEFLVRKSDRRAQVARLEREVAELESMRADTLARVRRLERDIAFRIVRAPIAGRLGDVYSLRPGAMVAAGARLAVVIPGSGLGAVAYFDSAAIGRIQPDQTGRLRLLGFPWTKHGALRARVRRVGNEPANGLVRVELDVAREPGTTVPLEHGLPGVVEIVVERTSPAALVLDAAGRFITRADTRERSLPTTSATKNND